MRINLLQCDFSRGEPEIAKSIKLFEGMFKIVVHETEQAVFLQNFPQTMEGLDSALLRLLELLLRCSSSP